MRRSVSIIFGVLIVTLTATVVYGQLSREDIEKLRRQGKVEGWTFTVDENPATQIPLDQLCGIREPEGGVPTAPGRPRLPKVNLPSRLDWRETLGDIPVRNQGHCGSCWAFAGTGVTEWAILKYESQIVDLAEQWLVSCNQNGWGCGGGGVDLGLDYYTWKTDPCGFTGAIWEADFPYAASNLPCGCPYDHPFILDSWGWIGADASNPTVSEIKTAIMTYGPVGCCVYVNSAFQAYSGGVFNGCVADPPGLNHGVVLVGWDDSQGPSGAWLMRNSWGPGWGEGGYMWITYGCSRIGAYAACVQYTGPKQPAISFFYPDGVPDTVGPCRPNTFTVSLSGTYNGTPAPGSGLLHYVINGGAVQTVPMIEISPARYEATLPEISCADSLAFYVSAEEQSGGRFYDPDPAQPHIPQVLSRIAYALEDNFALDQGWTVSGDALDGHWERGRPQTKGTSGEPTADYDDESIYCYLTANRFEESDLDGGTTYLDSPVFDLSARDGLVRYARWFSNDVGGTPDDAFEVFFSNDGGQAWTSIETVGPVLQQADRGWVVRSFWASTMLPLTNQMRLRFAVCDLHDSSIVEAAVDYVAVGYGVCEDCWCPIGDLNLDGACNPVDVAMLVSYVYRGVDPTAHPSHCPYETSDLNCDGAVTPMDVVTAVNHVYKGAQIPCIEPCTLP